MAAHEPARPPPVFRIDSHPPVQFSRRRTNLSFQHHAEVASLPEKEQEAITESSTGRTKPTDSRAGRRQDSISDGKML